MRMSKAQNLEVCRTCARIGCMNYDKLILLRFQFPFHNLLGNPTLIDLLCANLDQ